MSYNIINVGTQPNDETGDTLRDAFIKVNNNFLVIAPSITIIADTTVALMAVRQSAYYALTSANTIASLPPITGYEGKQFIIVNKSLGDINIYSNDGTSLDIFDFDNSGNNLKNMKNLSQGRSITLFNDGVNWTVINFY